MLKKFISTLISLVIATMIAQSSESSFTYVEGPPALYGQSKREKIDVAICINNPTYAGLKITGIKAYISTTEGINETSIWLSHELKLENDINIPDVLSIDVTPVETTLQNLNVGLLEASLEEPYVITDKPIYIGYSLNVDQNTTEEQKKPIILADNINSDGLFLHMSKSMMNWVNYSEIVEGVAYIIVSLEGNIPDYAIDFVNYNPIFVEKNEDFEATFSVSNKGAHAVNNLNYVYSYDDGETFEGFVELFSDLESGFANTSSVTVPFKGIAEPGRHKLNVEITKANGQLNEGANSSIECNVNVIPYVPVHRPLVEEYTGLWCGWCPRGFIAMEKLAEDFGRKEVTICYHYNDEMAVTNETPVYVSGLPKASIDRKVTLDPYYGTYSNTDFGIALDVENSITEMTIASIEVESILDGNSVIVNSCVEFIIDIDDANYEIGYVLTCNGLSNPKWLQSNSYSGVNLSENSPLYILSTWPEIVPGLIFNEVAVDASAMFGVKESIPGFIKTQEVYTNSYSFDIEYNDLIQDPNQIVVTAFIIDKNTNQIVNSNKCNINNSGIKEITAKEATGFRELYDLTGKKVNNPSSGIYIMKEYLKDGNIKTSKIFLH